MRSIGTICVALLVTVGWAAEMTTIDGFEYPDETALRQAWIPAEVAAAPELIAHESEGGKWAMKMPCDFTRTDLKRSVYDLDRKLDLTRPGAITFDFYCDDPAPVSGCTIYFRSGEGWYGAGFGPEKGWRRVVIGKGTFRTEGNPAGWSKVDGVRICAWRGTEKDTYCAVDNLQARSEDVALVAASGSGGENRTASETAGRVADFLAEVGVPVSVLTDQDVAAGALTGHKMAIFVYSPAMDEATASAVEEYVRAGGKIMFCYSIPPRIATLLGMADVAYKGHTTEGQFARIVFDQKALPGLPAAILQDSWNIQSFRPADASTKVLGDWQAADGASSGPAVCVNQNGAYMGHIITGGDGPAKGQFLLAVVGHFVPGAWEEAAQTALTGAKGVGPFATLAAAEDYLVRNGTGIPGAQTVAQKLAEAREARAKATQLVQEKRYPEALVAAAALRGALLEGYVLCHRSRDGEFRAVWNHSGTGDCGTWDDAMQRLAAGNFNAVVPNMWWGGVAHYDSKLLPHSATFDSRGDQIAQCVEAGKKYGIQVHPWKVNWNLSTAPKSFVDQMRAEGRLQKDFRGEEYSWLCPSDPRNFQLELDTMLEVVRNYDVDGVHFDYIRYPDGEKCYCDGCRERFEKFLGAKVADWPRDCYSGALREQYRQWRCDQISRLVKATSEQAHQIKPYIRISAAVFSGYPGCKDSVGQDWVMWCKQGWLDFVCPMDYETSDTAFRNSVARQVGLVGCAVPLYSGVGHFRISDEQALGQIEISRAQGSDGIIIFNMGRPLAETCLPKLALGITSQKALLPHDGPIVRFATSLDSSDPVVKVTADTLPVECTLASLGNHRKPATGARGTVELQDLSGVTLARLGDLPAVGGKLSLKVPRTEGVVRVAAVGELQFADGTSQRFIVRSRPYTFEAR